MAVAALQSPPSEAARSERIDQKIVLPGQTPEGQHVLSVLVKRTYEIVSGSRCARAEADKKLIPGDLHYGDPMSSTVKFESDFVPFKLATDVVLHGKAYAQPGQCVTTLTASLAVGRYRKDLLIIGDRVARFNSRRDPIFTDPQPFETMELRYERAYGGVDIYSEPKMEYVYPRNHLGRGFAVANIQKSVENLPLPNIEDPNDRLTPPRLCVGEFKDWERQPMPQGFGWTLKMWRPRSSYAGVLPADRALEQDLRKSYATLVPPAQRKLYEENPLPAMDFRFFNGASPGLAVPFLSGDESVELSNLDPQGKSHFQLPGERPKIGLDIVGGLQEPEVVLHTVMIRMDDRQLDLVWRGAVPYPGPDWLPEMKKMEMLIA
jgi:Uncharacterized protein conserved in bacteria